METILYFYSLKEAYPKPWLLQHYETPYFRLIRVGIHKNYKAMLRAGFRADYKLSRQKKNKKTSVNHTLNTSLYDELKPLVPNENRCYACYEEKMNDLIQERVLFLPYPALQLAELSQTPWNEILLQMVEQNHVLHPDYLLIGYHESILPFLWAKAKELKTLTYISDGYPMSPAFFRFMEDMELNFGLLTNVALKPPADLPVTVLDFGKQVKAKNIRVADKSIWLDFYPTIEKTKYAKEKMLSVTYRSIYPYFQNPQGYLDKLL